MTDWWIRPGAATDIDALADIERAADTLFPPGRLPPGDDTYPRESLVAASTAGLLFVAVRAAPPEREQVVAFAVCQAVDERLHLAGLAVDPAFGRQGIGGALVRRVQAECRTRGCAAVSLTTFADVPWNGPFYSRVGFAPIPEHDLPQDLFDALVHERRAGMSGRIAMLWVAGSAVSPRLRAVLGDITTLAVDAIVNAANEALAGGAGVDGAIHDAAGPQLLAACRRIGGCATGDATPTPGFRLPARCVIHAVGPVWQGGDHGEPKLLASCYRRAIEIAAREGFRSVAFPAISTGVFGYPSRPAAAIAIATVRAACPAGLLEEVIFCCFSERDLAVYQDQLERMG